MAAKAKAKAKPAIFCPPVKRTDAEHGHLYETEHGLFWGATTFINIKDKPALKFWYANQQATYVSEAAANLFEDAPVDKKMSRVSFLATLKKRIAGVRAAHNEMERAQQIGTEAHALVEWSLHHEMGHEAGKRPVARREAELAFQNFEEWRASVNLEPLWIEQVVYSKTHGYAGTIDLIARLDLKDELHDYGRVLTVIDWKTSKRHYDESNMQNAAYSWAVHEMGHSDGAPPPGLVVRLPKVPGDGFDTKLVHSAYFEDDFAAFLHCKGVWEWDRICEFRAEAKKQAKKSKKAADVPTPKPGETAIGAPAF